MSGMFGDPSPAPTQAAAPAPKPPATMPDTNSAAVLEARRKAQTDVLNRAGRQSTILTAPKDRIGDNFSSTTLGASNG
jgi:hypothetical protein